MAGGPGDLRPCLTAHSPQQWGRLSRVTRVPHQHPRWNWGGGGVRNNRTPRGRRPGQSREGWLQPQRSSSQIREVCGLEPKHRMRSPEEGDGGGGGRGGREREGQPVSPGAINPFRAVPTEPGPREACVLPLSSTLPPLPTGLERALGATQQARRTLPTAPRESNGQGSRDGHHGRHPRPLPEARRGAFGDPLFQARGFRPRPFPGHGLAVSEVVRPDVEGASGKDRVETECLLSTCQSKATSMAVSRVSRRMSSEGRRPAGDPQEPGSHLPAGGALGADRSAFLT